MTGPRYDKTLQYANILSTSLHSVFNAQMCGKSLLKFICLGAAASISFAFWNRQDPNLIKRLENTPKCTDKLAIFNKDAGGKPYYVEISQSDKSCKFLEIKKDHPTIGETVGYRHVVKEICKDDQNSDIAKEFNSTATNSTNNIMQEQHCYDQTTTIIAETITMFGELEFSNDDLHCQCDRYGYQE